MNPAEIEGSGAFSPRAPGLLVNPAEIEGSGASHHGLPRIPASLRAAAPATAEPGRARARALPAAD